MMIVLNPIFPQLNTDGLTSFLWKNTAFFLFYAIDSNIINLRVTKLFSVKYEVQRVYRMFTETVLVHPVRFSVNLV